MMAFYDSYSEQATKHDHASPAIGETGDGREARKRKKALRPIEV